MSVPIEVSDETFAGTDRFQIVRKLGAGGMGVVYEAIDRESGNRLALKTLKNVNPTAVFQFKQEFRALTELSHPNLVPLYELISDGEQWFFVMELIEEAVDFLAYARELPANSTTGTDPELAETVPRITPQASVPDDTIDRPVAQSSASASPATGLNLADQDTVDAPAVNVAPPVDQAVIETQMETVAGSAGDALTQVVLKKYSRVEVSPNSNDPGELTQTDVEPTVISATNAEDSAANDQTVIGPSVEQDSAANERTIIDVDHAQEQTIIGQVDSLASGDPDKTVVAPVEKTAVKVADFTRLRSVFRQLCAGVRALHQNGKLHRDLKPANALVSRKTGTVVLLDFGLVAELSRSKVSGTDQPTSRSATTHEISGTIGFMAPEQAAGRDLTEASDWYAFGVMLFQALTGRLPITGFASQILQRKQTQDAPPPADLVSGVPDDLNALCVKLLQRDPAKRPNGSEVAAVFASDGASAGEEDSFVPASMPFIGRERQLVELNQAFDESAAGRTVVCRVHGRSGAGKSTLIQHFLDDLSHRQNGVVLTGRCYEQESVPYKGIDSLIDAVTQYLRQPTTPTVELLPRNVAALARIFPVLKRVTLIDKLCREQAVASDLRELRRDAFQAFRELLSRIGQRRRLVVYLDDLQWGDTDSAALLTDLLSSPTRESSDRGQATEDRSLTTSATNGETPRLLLLLAYRSEYVGVSECLKSLAAAETTSVKWSELKVEALTSAETRTLARRLLRDDLPNVEASADRIVEQSGGSAYFVYELARHLNAGLDLSAIGGTGLDDVLWARVGRLSEEAQRFLHVVAVAGHPTRLKNILEASQLQQVSPRLTTMLRVEHLIRSSGPGLSAEVEAFHDRIRESVVNHLAPGVKKGHHAELAASLETTADAKAEDIALHLEGSEQFAKAGRLYQKAGEQAVQVLAFDRAEDFYRNAVRLAQTDADKADAYEKLIHFLTDMARFADAYSVGREAVQLFGVSLPKGFIPPLFIIDFLKAKFRIGKRPAAELLNLPAMSNHKLATAVRLTNACAKAAYQVRPELCVAVSTKIVNECLKHGNTPDSAISWMVFGAIFQGGVMGNHPLGYDYGRLALSIVDQYQQERQRPEVTFVVGYFGTSWMRPATDAEALWRTTYESGRATGDLFHTGCSCAGTTQSLLMRGVPFPDIFAKSDEFLDFLKPLSLREPIAAIESVRQTMRNLRGETRSRDTFSDDTFDEAAYVAKLSQFGSRHFAHYFFVNKMLTQYLWHEYDAAWTTSQASAKFLKESPGMLHSAEHHFLTGLIAAALTTRATGLARRRYLAAARASHKKLAKWASRCPHNFAHKERLVAAELARLSGSRETALTSYEAAMKTASQFGYVQIEAIANDLAAVACDPTGIGPQAASYRHRAAELFRKWGATAYAQYASGER